MEMTEDYGELVRQLRAGPGWQHELTAADTIERLLGEKEAAERELDIQRDSQVHAVNKMLAAETALAVERADNERQREDLGEDQKMVTR